MKKRIVGCAIVLGLLLTACGSGDKSSSTTSSRGENGATEVSENTEEIKEEKTEFNIGETWTVDGQWSLTVLGATKTDDRNQYSEKTPTAVYIVDYVYTNLGYEDSIMDGLFISMDDTIVDSAGTMGYSYPGDVTYNPKSTPVGATCNAQVCIGVDNEGTFELIVSEYDGNNDKQQATFIVDPSKEKITMDSVEGVDVEAPALGIGDTWTVDGQWSLTITGITETADRNEYSDKTPEAVYIIDYTYKNIGYEDDIMDGLFITLDKMIVDSAGSMGYSYPGNVTKQAKATPVGATCEAQECIGVDHAGDVRITITEYDGNDEKQSETFLLKVE